MNIYLNCRVFSPVGITYFGQKVEALGKLEYVTLLIFLQMMRYISVIDAQ
jgi:hypothetical protein